MSKVVVRSESIDQAIEQALRELQVDEHTLRVRVLEEPNKGWFGVGAKEAVVEVEADDALLPSHAASEAKHHTPPTIELRPDILEKASIPLQQACQFLATTLAHMGVDGKITLESEEGADVVRVHGDDIGLVIGRHGQTLDALQLLVNAVASRYVAEGEKRKRIVLDAEDYRARRVEALQRLADRMAQKVIRTRQKVVLEPMNAAERKIVHTQLQEYAGVKTYSRGQDPTRQVVIIPQ